MKKSIIIFIILVILSVCFVGCVDSKPNIETDGNTKGVDKMFITVNDHKLEVKLDDNSAVRELVKTLEKGDLTIWLHDYGNFEKTGSLGFSLPTSDKKISVDACDVVLYLGSNICIYYDKNSWSFTKIGKIQNVTKEKLKEILGKNEVYVTFSLE